MDGIRETGFGIRKSLVPTSIATRRFSQSRIPNLESHV
jgi:hypothetical protein